MVVARRMREPVITIQPHQTPAAARSLMRARRIRQLPVAEGGNLVGILSGNDVRAAPPLPPAPQETRTYAETLAPLPVSAAMSRQVVGAAPFTPVAHCGALATEHKLGCPPVPAGDRPEGIVTTTDVLDMLAEMRGVAEPGSRLEVKLPAVPGAGSEVTGRVEAQGVRLAGVATLPGPEAARARLAIRVQTIDPGPVARVLGGAGYRVLPAEGVVL